MYFGKRNLKRLLADPVHVCVSICHVHRSFSLVCFTSNRDAWSTEDVDTEMMMMTLTAAMVEDPSQQAPISSSDLHQVQYKF